MRRFLLYIIMCSLVLAACSSRHKATETVRAFLEENLQDPDFSTDFIAMDSTFKVRDSLLIDMQQQTSADKIFKKGIRFNKLTESKLIFVRMRIIQKKDTFVRTFYLNPEMTEVVAFKQN